MASGFGVDKAADGTGTTAADIRKINGALYKEGIISGCAVSTSGSSTAYTVSAGVVAIETAAGEIVLAPVAATTVTVTSPTSSRTDIVYAQQRYPSIEGDAAVVVGVASSLPSRAVELRTYTLPANASNTNSAVPQGGVDYSIPYGASLGVLYEYQDTTVGKYNNGILQKASGTIRLPTDRRLRISINTVLYSNGAAGFDNVDYNEYGFVPNIDGQNICIFTTPGLHQAWGTYSFTAYHNASAGTHVVGYKQFRVVGDADVHGFYGIDTNGFKRNGTVFTVEDVGPAV